MPAAGNTSKQVDVRLNTDVLTPTASQHTHMHTRTQAHMHTLRGHSRFCVWSVLQAKRPENSEQFLSTDGT